jgi:hypothetical protein
MSMKWLVERELAGETELLGERLPQCPLVHQLKPKVMSTKNVKSFIYDMNTNLIL